MTKVLRVSLPVLIFLVAWEAASRMGVVNSALFPPPTRALSALVEMGRSGELWRDMKASYGRLLLGMVCGVVIGTPIGLMTGRIHAVADVLVPLIQIFRPLPPVAIVPLVIVWFGIGESAKVFSIAFAVFFPIWLNTHLGAQQISAKFLWSASTLTHSRWRIFRSVIFPASLPLITAGLRGAIAVAFVMVFVSELAGASEGIGYEIAATHLAYRIDKMIAALAVLGASGALADALFAASITRIFPWLRFSHSK